MCRETNRLLQKPVFGVTGSQNKYFDQQLPFLSLCTILWILLEYIICIIMYIVLHIVYMLGASKIIVVLVCT